MSAKTTPKKLPKYAEKRLRPFIESGISKGIFTDDSTVIQLFAKFAKDPTNKPQIDALGGMKSELAQSFCTDAVLIDLTSILRQKRYTAHIDLYEVSHRTVGIAKGNPRPACFMIGQAVVEDTDGSVMETALFRMSLWDGDTAIADDVEADGTYSLSVSCRNLDAEVLDLRPLSGITSFNTEEYEHTDRKELLKSMFDISPISDLDDDISRSPTDYRLVEATVSYAGVQNSRAGSQFGKMLLKDDSTMTMEAIESGEKLLLNCITSTSIASRFGKYSRILALLTTKDNGEYGLSANVETAIGIITVAPPVAETSVADDDDDDAADYFKTTDIKTIGDDDDDDDDDSTEDVVKATDDAEEETVEADTKETPTTESVDDDDDWEDW
mgnify:CR=1 FL=1